VIKGDAKIACIAAASILAKVERDRLMTELAQQYPHYGFDRHFGYSTPEHMDALRQHGPCAIHRRSFAPVREAHARFGIVLPEIAPAVLQAAEAADQDPDARAF